MTLRSRIAMLMAEFLGTAVLTTSVINIARSQIGIGYFVAIGVGLTYGLLMLILGNAFGSHLNPAITIGQWTIREINTVMAIGFLAAQALGAVAAWRLAEYFANDTLRNIAGKSYDWRVLFAELAGTFVFSFFFAAAVYQGYRGLRWAAAVGGGLFLGIIVATAASNGIINPAVALGGQSWGRGYVLGPIIGSIIGMNLYAFLFTKDRNDKVALAETSRSSTVIPEPRSETRVVPAKSTARVVSTTRKNAKKPVRKTRSGTRTSTRTRSR